MKKGKKTKTISLFARHKALLEAIPDIIMEVDKNRVYTWANKAGLEFFGPDVVGREASDYFVGKQDTYDAVRPLFEGRGDVIYLESRQRRRDGAVRLLAWWCKTLINRQGEVTGVISSGRDITESRQASDRLRESEERFRAIFDNAADGIVLTDAGRRFLMVNKCLCSMLGYTEGELLTMSTADIHPVETRSETERAFLSLFRREIPVAHDIPVQRRDGSVFFADISLSFFTLSGEELAVGFIRDVTERNRMIEALRQSEGHFRALIESSPMGIHIYRVDEGKEPVFVGYNPAAEAILGVDHGKFMNHTILEAFPGLAGTETPERYRDAALRGTLWHNQEIRYKDEKIVGAFEVYAFRIRPGLMAAMFTDITGRVKMEEELRRQNDFIDRIMETSPICVVMVNRDGRITFANREAERVFGLSRKEIIAKKFNDPDWKISAIDGSPYPAERLPFSLVMTTKSPVSGIEHAIELADGTKRCLSINGSPLFDRDGELNGVVFAIEDITDRLEEEARRRELEAQLVQTQKLESIGRLAGGIAHDLNNLLTPIIGYADFYLQAGRPQDGELEKSFSGILNAAERAKNLTRQLLAFSRKQPLILSVISLNSVISSILDMLSHTLRENIRLHTDLADDLHNIRADHSQIDQIIINLATNAQDAMPNGGVIEIRSFNTKLDGQSPVAFGIPAPGDYAALSLTDSGEGVDPETAKHIFEPFFTTKNAGAGTGLGLATVYGIVKQHNGYIRVDSAQGEGSTFTVFFPAFKEPVESRPEGPALKTVAAPSGVILLVEDNDDVRLMTERFLQSLGHSVVVASSGKAALRLAAAHRDCVLLITDVIMPDMNGVELYRKMRGDLPALRVLYMSGYTDDIIRFHGISGADAPLIMKPFTIQQLARKISSVLRG